MIKDLIVRPEILILHEETFQDIDIVNDFLMRTLIVLEIIAKINKWD
jgi:hypothetical protein